jgi:hypothetical protein
MFPVRSAYRLAGTRVRGLDAIGSSSVPTGERSVWKKVWKLQVIPKVRNFIWKMVKNGLPTNENRFARHIVQNASCEICYNPREDCYHAVMLCPHATALRAAMREYWALL